MMLTTTTETIETGLAETGQVIAEANEKFRNDEYRDLINEFETVTKLLLEQITDTIEQRYDVGVRFPEKWRRSLCHQAQVIQHAPSLLICAEAPAGYETLRALYDDWDCYCTALGSRVLEFVSELEHDSPFATPALSFDGRHSVQPRQTRVPARSISRVCRQLSSSAKLGNQPANSTGGHERPSVGTT